jgi:AcrR family transcriptional regulator
VPRLWSNTVETHRREVRDAILDTAAGLVGQYGLLAVTMSQIAEKTGIGRATLYKYFPDVEAILLAWHRREIARHLEHLAEVRDRAAAGPQRVQAVLEAYAFIVHQSRGHHDAELTAFLHRDTQVAGARQHVGHLLGQLLIQGVQTGEIRDDVAPEELAIYCLHALGGAGSLSSKAAVRRLVALTLSGLRPPA